AGSGKTRVITYRIAYLIRNAASRPENILAVTFTNKAADEMRQRVHGLLGPVRPAEPLISTFHSFCVRLLRREIHRIGYKPDFSIYDSDDQKRLVKQVLQELGKPQSEFQPGRTLSRISYAKSHSIPPASYARQYPAVDAEDISLIYSRYNARLRSANSLDFDDLLLKAVEILHSFPERRDHYSDQFRYILVDEYQDTNVPQYNLLRLLTSRHDNLFVVGDEDQSIYKFRGATIRNILSFERDFPGARIIKLEQNYRSTQTILDVASAVVRNNTERKEKTLWTRNRPGEAATCCRALSPRKEADWVVGRIGSLLEDNPDLRLAILYRANFLSRNFEDVLLERGIPYAVVGSVAFFGRMEIKDMLAYLRVIFNPEDDVALLRIINTPARGIGATTVELLTRAALDKGIPVSRALGEFAGDPQLAGRSHRALRRFRQQLEAWMAERDGAGVADVLRGVLEGTAYADMLRRQESAPEAESRIANIEELVRAAEEAEERGETVFEFLDRASLASELDHLDPKARVSLMTVHSAKGLEFDVVFLAGMEEGLFPHALSSNSTEELEEERRLCYVGITRAKEKLFLSWTPFRRSFGRDLDGPASPSRFFDEMPFQSLQGWPAAGGFLEEEEEEYEDGQSDEEAEASVPLKSGRPAAGRDTQDPPRTMQERRAYIQTTQAAGSAGGGRALRPGVRIRHAQFGDGIILKRERSGNDFKLTITFSRVGKKTLIERYARLEVL
ncbi:MAG: UvrD-helicase domain-containing protein, partial [Acidobacteriota bacterium]